MKQMNVNLSELDLRRLTTIQNFTNSSDKSKAFRLALEIAEKVLTRSKNLKDLARFEGVLSRGKTNKNPRFKSEDDLWS